MAALSYWVEGVHAVWDSSVVVAGKSHRAAPVHVTFPRSAGDMPKPGADGQEEGTVADRESANRA